MATFNQIVSVFYRRKDIAEEALELVKEIQQTLRLSMRITRLEKKLSLTKVANQAGISKAHLSDIELGRRFPSEKVLVKIIKALSPQKI